ncbi:MAG: NADH-quinone oxidoreductase subunit L [Cyclobacteriaceae bacterium]|jgi:NADH-quinone oxidoreductase subunit L
MGIYLIILILFLPAIGGLFGYFLARRRWQAIPVLIGTSLALIPAMAVWYTCDFALWRFEWLPGMELGWRLDRLSITMVLVVLAVSILVQIFSVKYMSSDQSKARYFAFLGFFTSSMLGLLLADHFLLLFIFWELVGFSSFLLIGFWWQNANNSTASSYAFIMNRVADAALLGGLIWLGIVTDNFFFSDLTEDTTFWISILLVIGACGKSAQGPFFTWLPRAMAGPTPVSALIHAATMVAAGVYLLIRVSPILPSITLSMLVYIGAITALLSAITAVAQRDIKKVLAYSTISQLGYMVMGIGAGAPEAAFFHLFSHAFFKAGLFLCAGSVIHYMQDLGHHERAQDMFAMGGLRKPLFLTFLVFTICALALAGLPFTSGFLSKEGILVSLHLWAKSQGGMAYLILVSGLVTAGLTAYYMTRQWLLVFFGVYRGEHLQYATRESPTMYAPLIFLALGSMWFWYAPNPLSHDVQFVQLIFGQKDIEYPVWLAPAALALFAIGSITAYRRFSFVRDRKVETEQTVSRLAAPTHRYQLLAVHAFYVDAFYERLVYVGYQKLSRTTSWIDRKIIDRFILAISVFVVLLSKLVDLLDKLIVDGLVVAIAKLSHHMGNFVRLFHASRVQLHFVWAVTAVLLLLIGLQIFS